MKQAPKKQKTTVPPPKHGIHEKHPEQPFASALESPTDPEDPQWPPEADPSIEVLTDETERELRGESEDPDAPTSL